MLRAGFPGGRRFSSKCLSLLEVVFQGTAIRFECHIVEFVLTRLTKMPAIDFSDFRLHSVECVDFGSKEQIGHWKNHAAVRVLIRIRREEFQARHAQTDLLEDFTIQGVLGTFSGIHEAAWQAKLTLAWILCPDQQQNISRVVRCDGGDRRGRRKMMDVPARWAAKRICSD